MSIVEQDAAASARRLADIRAGLAGPEVDRSFWRDKAQARLDALDEDGATFGLVPHEEAEAAMLRTILAG